MKSILVLGEAPEEFLQGLRRTHDARDIRSFDGGGLRESRDVFFLDLFQWVLKEKPLVVTYSSGWKNETSLMSEVFAHLTGRTAESVQYFLFDMGVEVKSLSLTQGLLSIKDLMRSIDQSLLSETQRLRFQVLGELIR